MAAPGNSPSGEGTGEEGTTQEERQAGASFHTGNCVAESCGRPQGREPDVWGRPRPRPPAGPCFVGSAEARSQRGLGNEGPPSGRKIAAQGGQKTKTIILSTTDACTTPARTGPIGHPLRALLCSSRPVSTKAMTHRFPVETETLRRSPGLSPKEEMA